VLPIALELAERFTEDPDRPDISVTAGGSGVGIAALLQENTDIAMSSRAIKFKERASFREQDLPFDELVLAYDALAVVAHKTNPVDSLTLQQLKGIFQGKITNWKQVGGEDQNIVAFNRESSSGTYGFFQKKVLEGDKFGKLETVGANGELVEKVADNKLTIAYVGLAYVDPKSVKQIKIYNPDLKRSIEPSIKTAMKGEYPLKRPLFFYFLQRDRQRLQPIIDFVKSQAGQQMVIDSGYPPNSKYYKKP
ncbi:MAG: phosphate ABC transporter substrate-binding protein, partial [Bacteroidota bacterium]